MNNLRGFLFFGYNNGTTFSFFADFEKQAVKYEFTSLINDLLVFCSLNISR